MKMISEVSIVSKVLNLLLFNDNLNFLSIVYIYKDIIFKILMRKAL